MIDTLEKALWRARAIIDLIATAGSEGTQAELDPKTIQRAADAVGLEIDGAIDALNGWAQSAKARGKLTAVN